MNSCVICGGTVHKNSDGMLSHCPELGAMELGEYNHNTALLVLCYADDPVPDLRLIR